MTREEAAKLLPIIKAFSEGKDIEYFDTGSNKWRKSINPLFGDICYRIKPTPTYRPFANADECWQEMLKHQPVGWVEKKDTKSKEFINMISFNTESYPVHIDNIHYPFSDMLFTDYTFADGSAFGVKIEKEG